MIKTKTAQTIVARAVQKKAIGIFIMAQKLVGKEEVYDWMRDLNAVFIKQLSDEFAVQVNEIYMDSVSKEERNNKIQDLLERNNARIVENVIDVVKKALVKFG